MAQVGVRLRFVRDSHKIVATYMRFLLFTVALSVLAQDVTRVDHYVKVKSMAPAMTGQTAQVYVREVVLAGMALRGPAREDRVVLFVAPKLVGSGGLPLIALPGPSSMADALCLEAVAWRRLGDDMMIVGEIPRTASPHRDTDR